MHPRQLTFGSADVAEPLVGDLSGLLVGPGHLLVDPRLGTRISIVVVDNWRVDGLRREFELRDLAPTTEVTTQG